MIVREEWPCVCQEFQVLDRDCHTWIKFLAGSMAKGGVETVHAGIYQAVRKEPRQIQDKANEGIESRERRK